MEATSVFHVVDLHAGGEPLRVIVDGYPPIPGETLLDRRDYLQQHLDHWRRRLMWEPWGHRDMYGCLLLPPERPDSRYGLVFMHNEGYSTMCGHAVIAVAKLLVETGRVPWDGGSTEVTMPLDVPSGQVVAHAVMAGGHVNQVWYENVPAWAGGINLTVTVEGRPISVDIGYGGAFYAIVAADAVGLDLVPEAVPALRRWAAAIRQAVEAEHRPVHPEEPRIAGLYGVIFTGRPRSPEHVARQVTVFADGQVDRSPCGSCVAARLAVLAARREWPTERDYPVESVLDTVFTGRIIGPGSPVGPYPTVRTTVAGTAYVVAFRRFFVNPRDPVPPFLIR
jgi:proline racemase